MKKTLLIISCVLAAFFATSCGSTEQTNTAAEQAALSSVEGADGVQRPAWVLTGKKDNTGIYAVGSGKMSSDQNSLKLARANGRAELGRTVASATKSVLRSYTQDTGNEKDVLNYLEEVLEIKSANILSGSEQVDMWKAKDGTIFVLMFVPYKAVLPEVAEISKQISDFTQDAKTILTEVKAQTAFDKYFGEE